MLYPLLFLSHTLSCTISLCIQLGSIMDEVQVQLVTLLEDDSRSTRLITTRILQKVMALCGPSCFHPDRLHALYMELLKRLDDSSDEIRVAVAKTFVTFFSCFPEEYDRRLYKAHLETLYTGLLVHLDDPDQTIQEAVLGKYSPLFQIFYLIY